MLKVIMLTSVMLMPMTAFADSLNATEKKQIAYLEAQIELVEAQFEKQKANLQAQIDFVVNRADERERDYRSQCTVAFLGIGCPKRAANGQIANPFDQFDRPTDPWAQYNPQSR